MLQLFHHEAIYYFTKATVKRAMNEVMLMDKGIDMGLHGNSYKNVAEATEAAIKNSLPEDLIFVGGSTFIVADLLANRDALNLY